MADEGASPKEQLMEAARRNNTDLLQELLDSGSLKNNADATANFLNTTTDALGNSALHVAAQYGSYEVLDTILDQEGVEIDGQERRDGDTCLHKAVRHVNELAAHHWDEGRAVVDILIDAGCDPRIRNKAKMKAIDLVDPRNKELRAELQKAELQLQMGGDTVEDDDEEGRHDGPGSESD
ncbi:ankyrin [Teratosphaeria nubilosa]|uniref:Ankyrin n=1 Tax=Teratosphaeria nubilosa TaxID=161662 RepID=A0A6G1L2H9_9PEZI|nr:ankyrin [Teratosphaeria nubilosa]